MKAGRDRVRFVMSGNIFDERTNQRRAPGELPRLYRRPYGTPQSHSARRLNTLARGLGRVQRYLEIGVYEGVTFQSVDVARRIGVDPYPRFDARRLPVGAEFFARTSDDFFADCVGTGEFDLAFIDGLHTFEQTYRDVINTLAHMSTGPALIDDTVPDSAETALPDLDEALAAAAAAGDLSGRWHGDVWKVVAALALHHPELSLRTIVEVGNCQTLVWRRDAASPVTPLDETTLDQIRDLRYEDVMASGIPEFFAGGSEDEVIAQCLSEIGPRAWIRSYS